MIRQYERNRRETWRQRETQWTKLVTVKSSNLYLEIKKLNRLTKQMSWLNISEVVVVKCSIYCKTLLYLKHIDSALFTLSKDVFTVKDEAHRSTNRKTAGQFSTHNSDTTVQEQKAKCRPCQLVKCKRSVCVCLMSEWNSRVPLSHSLWINLAL